MYATLTPPLSLISFSETSTPRHDARSGTDDGMLRSGKWTRGRRSIKRRRRRGRCSDLPKMDWTAACERVRRQKGCPSTISMLFSSSLSSSTNLVATCVRRSLVSTRQNANTSLHAACTCDGSIPHSIRGAYHLIYHPVPSHPIPSHAMPLTSSQRALHPPFVPTLHTRIPFSPQHSRHSSSVLPHLLHCFHSLHLLPLLLPLLLLLSICLFTIVCH